MANQLRITINGIQHIGIPVTDLENSERFYNKLGFNNVMRSEFAYQGQTGICMMMKNEAMIIELYQMPENKLAEIRERKNGHIDHIAFDVNDINQTFEVLRDADVQIDEAEPVYLPFWKNGCKYFNIIGPDGERLEFNQIL